MLFVWRCVQIADIASGRALLPQPLPGCTGDLVWSKDGSTCWVTVQVCVSLCLIWGCCYCMGYAIAAPCTPPDLLEML
jgi:hypothetical protein